MTNEVVCARLPPEIVNAINDFQKRQGLVFRADAIAEMLKAACSTLGIDLSNIPAAPTETQVETGPIEEEEPSEWLCPQTRKVGDYARCDRRKKQYPEECKKTCKALTSHWRGVIFPGEETEEEEAAEPETIVEEEATENKNDDTFRTPKVGVTDEKSPMPSVAYENPQPQEKPKKPKNDWIACPNNDDWVKKVDCDKCLRTSFIVWSNCYNERKKNPNSPLFQIKKPKPAESNFQ